MLEESLAECERALKLDPLVKANGSVLNTYLYLGQYDKFLDSLPDSSESSFLLFYRGFGEFYERQMEPASRDFERAYQLQPSLYAQIGKAMNEAIVHRPANGLELLHTVEDRIKERGVGDPEAVYKVAQAYAVLQDKLSALRALRSSVESGFFCYPYLAADPLLSGLRDDPEFAPDSGSSPPAAASLQNPILLGETATRTFRVRKDRKGRDGQNPLVAPSLSRVFCETGWASDFLRD